MRFQSAVPLLFSCVFLPVSAPAQQAPQRDPQALVVLQHAFAAMGATVPSDSVATGNVTLVAGSKTENGTIRILTRGLEQSAEQVQTPDGSRSVVYSQGRANRIDGSGTTAFTLELAASSQTPNLPLVLIATALNNPDAAFQYIGLETLGSAQVHHLRLWNTFSSNSKLQPLAEFTVRELWIDAATGLPRKLFYNRREARGAAPKIPLEVFYEDYRNVGGMFYPFLIKKSLNGTPWADLTGDFCTRWNEREFTWRKNGHVDQEVQAGADRDAAAADRSGNRER